MDELDNACYKSHVSVAPLLDHRGCLTAAATPAIPPPLRYVSSSYLAFLGNYCQTYKIATVVFLQVAWSSRAWVADAAHVCAASAAANRPSPFLENMTGEMAKKDEMRERKRWLSYRDNSRDQHSLRHHYLYIAIEHRPETGCLERRFSKDYQVISRSTRLRGGDQHPQHLQDIVTTQLRAC